MAAMPSVCPILLTPNTKALPSVRQNEFSKRDCNAHIHSNPMTHTMLNANFGISSGVICSTIHEYTLIDPAMPKISQYPVAFAKFDRNAAK